MEKNRKKVRVLRVRRDDKPCRFGQLTKCANSNLALLVISILQKRMWMCKWIDVDDSMRMSVDDLPAVARWSLAWVREGEASADRLQPLPTHQSPIHAHYDVIMTNNDAIIPQAQPSSPTGKSVWVWEAVQQVQCFRMAWSPSAPNESDPQEDERFPRKEQQSINSMNEEY